MTNQEILNRVANQWVSSIIKGMLPKINFPQNGVSQGISQLLGIDLSNYNIINEFSFLVPDLIQFPLENMIDTALRKVMVKDEQIPDYVCKMVQSCIKQCKTTGRPLNIYGFEFSGKSFENLNNLLEREFGRNNVRTENDDIGGNKDEVGQCDQLNT